jgi:hypothetical protein
MSPLHAADRAAGGLHVEHRGAVSLPDEVSAADGPPLRLTGLSGVTWLGDDRYVAVLDNSASLIRFRLEIAPDGTPRSASAFRAGCANARNAAAAPSRRWNTASPSTPTRTAPAPGGSRRRGA